MSELETNEEQVAKLKQIWKAYGIPIVIAGLLGAIVSSGFYYYKHQKIKKAEAASTLYQDILDQYLTVQGTVTPNLDTDTLDQIVIDLNKQYSQTIYSQFAALLQIKWKVEQGKIEEAKNILNNILDNPYNDELDFLARTRLAKILLISNEQADAQQALIILDKIKVNAEIFASTFQEIKGDTLLALGKPQKAREAYQLALNAHILRGSSTVLVQMKLDDLADLES